MTKPRYSYIRLGVPLPADVFATLLMLIGKAWPDAAIISDPERAGVPREFWPRWSSGEQLIRVDTARRPKAVSKKAAQEAVAEHAAEEGEYVPTTSGIGDDGWVKLSAPEELSHLLGAMCHRILEGTEGVVNYLEWEVGDAETGTRTVVSAARSKGQTPHALRQAAEQSNDQLRAALSVALAHAEGRIEDPEALAGCRIALDEANARAANCVADAPPRTE